MKNTTLAAALPLLAAVHPGLVYNSVHTVVLVPHGTIKATVVVLQQLHHEDAHFHASIAAH